MRPKVNMGAGLARSTGRGGGRRRRRARPRVLEISVGATALAVAVLALGRSMLAADPPPVPEAQKHLLAAPQQGAGDGRAVGVLPGGKAGSGHGSGDAAKADGPSKHSDPRAFAYFAAHKATKRVKDIRVVGGYLRIYTDLPDSADNSKQAIKLCETGLDYLVGELGSVNPVVFVQARFGENGNPVLANILGPGDSDCRVTYPKPGG
ncbi:hypothetical protein ACFYSC_12810 [Streptosporangium sp. NPDC004379]|uniref:hypothetical protein n=1 Tax=Streptosporangium sp. NPDC004379 TaxID=3366189 RepID=UPI00369418FA